MERKLNEQWIEEFDGKMHMLKVMENTTGGCKGCDLQVVDNCYGSCGAGDGCNFIIKDLGILNDDGCLPSSWGDYPTISVPSYEKEPWCVYAYLRRKEVVIKQEKAWGDTEQEAIDAWNRRA